MTENIDKIFPLNALEYAVENPGSPKVAAALSLIFPGLGQAYSGRVLRAVLIGLTTPLLFFSWPIGVAEAYFIAPQMATRRQRLIWMAAYGACALCLALLFLVAMIGA